MAKKTVDAATLNKWMSQKKALIIDVRNQDEFDAAHIKGAKLMPLDTLKTAKLPAAGDKKIVIHCALGRRGDSACDILAKKYPKKVFYNLEGGLESWKKEGLAVEGKTPAKASAPKMSGESCATDKSCNMSMLDCYTENKIRTIIGTVILACVILGHYIAPVFYGLIGIMAIALIISGLTGKCMMRDMLCCNKSSCKDKSHHHK